MENVGEDYNRKQSGPMLKSICEKPCYSKQGLPDCIFAYQKYKFWYIKGGLLYILFGLFYGHLILVAIWYILPSFQVLVCCTMKNLATQLKTG
jgi:hypothetical protein